MRAVVAGVFGSNRRSGGVVVGPTGPGGPPVLASDPDVHAGPVDTDMAAGFDLEKIPPASVAASALDALEADEPEAVADDYSRAIKADSATTRTRSTHRSSVSPWH
jgi:hypothetical protein